MLKVGQTELGGHWGHPLARFQTGQKYQFAGQWQNQLLLRFYFAGLIDLAFQITSLTGGP